MVIVCEFSILALKYLHIHFASFCVKNFLFLELGVASVDVCVTVGVAGVDVCVTMGVAGPDVCVTYGNLAHTENFHFAVYGWFMLAQHIIL